MPAPKPDLKNYQPRERSFGSASERNGVERPPRAGGLACRLGRCFCFAEVSTGDPHPRRTSSRYQSVCAVTSYPRTKYIRGSQLSLTHSERNGVERPPRIVQCGHAPNRHRRHSADVFRYGCISDKNFLIFATAPEDPEFYLRKTKNNRTQGGKRNAEYLGRREQ